MTSPSSNLFTPSLLPENFTLSPDALRERVGRATALALAAHGATVILHGRDVKKLEATYDEIEARGGATPAIMPLDFFKAIDADYHQLAESIHAEFKRLDTIVHCAAHVGPLKPMTALDGDAWQNHFVANVRAPVGITRACMPMLKRAAQANVVFVSEEHALAPKAYWGAYAASKAMLHHAVACWADEIEREANIRLSILIPGPFATPARNVTHPGEAVETLSPVGEIARHTVYLATQHLSSAGHVALHRVARHQVR
jgi:NAD(P)-dependent dehydrogenase (short-subunit alcohol dehydrogenase family)